MQVASVGIIALGFSILSGKYFQADNPASPETPGYFIEGAAEEGGAAAGPSMEEVLNKMTASEGEKVWSKCSACHTIDSGGANGIGPNLYGVMGKTVGASNASFAYSSALTGVGGTWDWDNMSAWLKSPKAFASGTKMSFAGLSKIEDRAAVMLYMNENGSNLAVPEFVAAVAEEGEVAEGEAVSEGEEEAVAAAEQDAAAQENEGGV